MRLLFDYLRRWKHLVFMALLLATASSLDSITEKSITETIRNLTTGEHRRMMVLVAHRLSTIAHAKRIYVLARGLIVESGTHDSLLGTSGLYAALWREQSARREA